MLMPIVEVPETIARGMEEYREIFFRDEGFEHISRYVSGLILSPNKTMAGIYDQQVWEGYKPSERAMHAAVFEANWSSEELMGRHREIIGLQHQGKGREVISLDWTLAHHERGPKIYANSKAYDYVEKRNTLYQTVVTAVVANRVIIDGIAIEVQKPSPAQEELAYLNQTAKQSYEQMEQAHQRLLELMHHFKHKLAYKKRTEIALEIVQQLEAEGHFALADYAFDNGVLTLDLTKFIESRNKHWVSELESSRNINWQGQWRRVDDIAVELRHNHPESFRLVEVKMRNGEEKQFKAFTKVVRLKRYGKKRLVIMHENLDLTDEPRFLLTDALHWESSRVIETWSYRWTAEIFHEFSKQVTGLESSQVRKEEAVKRHFRLSCVAQSIVQRAPATASKSERFSFADGKITFGQKCRSIARECFFSILKLVKNLFARGQSAEQVLETLIPA